MRMEASPLATRNNTRKFRIAVIPGDGIGKETVPQGLRTLLTNGQNRIKPTSSYMPPVGRTWTDDQFRALEQYLKAVVYKGDTSGG